MLEIFCVNFKWINDSIRISSKQIINLTQIYSGSDCKPLKSEVAVLNKNVMVLYLIDSKNMLLRNCIDEKVDFFNHLHFFKKENSCIIFFYIENINCLHYFINIVFFPFDFSRYIL